jgi:hypothetical protein
MTQRHLDLGSWLVVGVTLLLFIAALFVKGFTHDILLEAGVFLVSVKLIIMAYKNGAATAALNGRLDRLDTTLARIEDRMPMPVLGDTARTRN